MLRRQLLERCFAKESTITIVVDDDTVNDLIKVTPMFCKIARETGRLV